ncbi:hypothetical protein [Rothia nasimurium]|uniref:hypothetical protein n=1 Tax=Rothia nasimurium TaxID=85336 RepID=UPI001F40D6EE|nr:hypothetical protein [Rothia nasimurium]
MTRRIRPPKHPVTGHPYVDNEIRNAWRDYRNYLRTKPPHHTILAHGDLYGLVMTYRGHPRKARKIMVKYAWILAFRYHPTAYYTPERTILK